MNGIFLTYAVGSNPHPVSIHIGYVKTHRGEVISAA